MKKLINKILMISLLATPVLETFSINNTPVKDFVLNKDGFLAKDAKAAIHLGATSALRLPVWISKKILSSQAPLGISIAVAGTTWLAYWACGRDDIKSFRQYLRKTFSKYYFNKIVKGIQIAAPILVGCYCLGKVEQGFTAVFS